LIAGVGTDITSIPRFAAAWQRHGVRLSQHVLAPREQAELQMLGEPARARFIARRWAAKEALAKALGTGLARGLHARLIAVTHDDAGAPGFSLEGSAAECLAARGLLRSHLSISDDGDYALAFVVLESC
jgi:holo-[acyl-carrier protein] synthase